MSGFSPSIYLDPLLCLPQHQTSAERQRRTRGEGVESTRDRRESKRGPGGERGGGGGGVSRSNNQLSRQASHLYCHSPLPPVTGELNETRPWRSSDLPFAPFSPTVTPHRGRRGVCKGGRAPGDHVSGSDLHYGTIERLLFPPGGGEELCRFIFLFVPLPARLLQGRQRNLCLTQANVASAAQAGGL